MRKIRIQGARLLHADSANDGQPMSWLAVEDDGDDSVLDSLPAGVVAFDSRINLASAADDKFHRHDCVWPGLWSRGIVEGEAEMPPHWEQSRYLLILRGVSIFHAAHLGSGLSELWARLNPGALIAALGDAVVYDSGYLPEDYADGDAGRRPHIRPEIRL